MKEIELFQSNGAKLQSMLVSTILSSIVLSLYDIHWLKFKCYVFVTNTYIHSYVRGWMKKRFNLFSHHHDKHERKKSILVIWLNILSFTFSRVGRCSYPYEFYWNEKNFTDLFVLSSRLLYRPRTSSPSWYIPNILFYVSADTQLNLFRVGQLFACSYFPLDSVTSILDAKKRIWKRKVY